MEIQKNSNDKFAFWALVSGVAAIPMSSAIIPGILFGIAAITLGILSKLNYERFNLHNILGITFGGISILLSCVVFLGMIILLTEQPELMSEMIEMSKMYYGQ